MSSHNQASAHDDHAHDEGEMHFSVKEYAIGFILSVILTVIPFWLVMDGVLSTPAATAIAIMVLGAIQIVVHMIYFLHMNTKSEGGWTAMALIFTVIIVFITLVGSLWVMHHLNTKMMPTMEHVRQAP
jgi:cytochrome o ubiquinol oxidase operon protein cyoD